MLNDLDIDVVVWFVVVNLINTETKGDRSQDWDVNVVNPLLDSNRVLESIALVRNNCQCWVFFN